MTSLIAGSRGCSLLPFLFSTLLGYDNYPGYPYIDETPTDPDNRFLVEQQHLHQQQQQQQMQHYEQQHQQHFEQQQQQFSEEQHQFAEQQSHRSSAVMSGECEYFSISEIIYRR